MPIHAPSMRDPIEMRRWCEAVALTLPVQHITPHGQPYLDRYFLAGYSPYKWNTPSPQASLFLHHFLASDPQGEVHSHPWGWATSVILAGGYREHRCAGAATVVETYGPGAINRLDPDTKHRVELLEADCWSLLLVGPWAQPWAFFGECS